MLQRFWNAISNGGLAHVQQDFLRGKLVLTNRIAFLFLLICLLYLVPAAVNGDGVIFTAGALTGAVYGAVLLLLRQGKLTAARMLMVLAVSINVPVTIAFYVSPPLWRVEPEARMVQLVLVVLPIILFDLRERRPLILGILLVIVSYFLPGPISRLLGITEQTVTHDPGNLINTVNLVAAFTALIATIVYMKQIFLKSERQRDALLKDLERQNSLLRVKEASLHERTAAQARSQRELEALTLKLEQQNWRLEVSQKELVDAVAAVQKKKRRDEQQYKLVFSIRWQEDDTLERWSDRVLHKILPAFEGMQGALYLMRGRLDNREDASDMHRLATYGMPQENAGEVGKKSFAALRSGDGLVGQLARSGEALKIESHPRMLGEVVTGSLRLRADSLYLIPLKLGDVIVGLIEITTRRKLQPEEYELLESVCEDIAASLAGLRSQVNIEAALADVHAQALTLAQETGDLQTQMEKLKIEVQHKANQNDEYLQLVYSLEKQLAEKQDELADNRKALEETRRLLAQQEKMAGLGQLVAGLAHEINSPLGAIKAARENMSDSLIPLMQFSPEYFRLVPEHHLILLQEFIYTLLRPTAMPISSREERQVRRDIKEVVSEAGIPEAEQVASMLMEAGFQDKIQRYLPLFMPPIGTLTADVAYRIGQLTKNLRNIDLATEKSRKVVLALKRYSYAQGQSGRVFTDINEQLDTIITLYVSQLKYGIDVTLRYDEKLPKVPVYADELVQVWTNLLQNAIQAMDGKGQLAVETLQQGEMVEVSITDNGPGIPQEIIDKIFNPYFTTKPQGMGTGLGLDICRRIVHRHGGKIHVLSALGKTTFFVLLPLHPQG